MKCCKPNCNEEATVQMFDPSKDDACYNVFYSCNKHIEDVKVEGDIVEPICNL